MKLLRLVLTVFALILSMTSVQGKTDDEWLEMTVSSDDPSGVVFSADEKNCPLPEDLWQQGSERGYRIHFDQPGTYHYTVYQNTSDGQMTDEWMDR